MQRFTARLRRLARLRGIQLAFTDTLRRRRAAEAETLLAILRARGDEVHDERSCEEAISAQLAARSARVLPPSLIQWIDSPGQSVTFDALRFNGELTLVDEQGTALGTWQVRAGEQTSLGPLAPGYYTTNLVHSSVHERSWLAVAPKRCFERKEKRAGLFAPPYAVRTSRSTGASDLRDVEVLVEKAASAGAATLATLPMLAAYLDRVAFEPSPYAAVSRLFWNELYVDLASVPELEDEQSRVESDRTSEGAKRLHDARLVDYEAEIAWKQRYLAIAAARMVASSGERRDRFEAYVRRRPLARRYAEFRAATEHFGRTWPFWERGAASGDLAGTELPRQTVEYHLYAQFIMDEQMSAFSDDARRRGCGLFLDFPLGSNSHGFDVWNEPKLFIRGLAIGAPPDLAYAQGQNWGFRPADPDALRESGYVHWIECIRHQLRCASLLRLDHVMGLHRLYVVPEGFSAAHGAYLKYFAEDFYAILSIESHRFGAEIVGEDLGTVPSVVRHSMREHAVRRLYVLQRELQHGAVRAPDAIGEDVVASLNNHDMPPFRAFWDGSDLPEKAALGVIAPERLPQEQEKRATARQKLLTLLRELGLLEGEDVGDVMRAALRYLGSSNALLVLVTLEDLWLERESQNIPTTSTERPNWRYKFIDDIEKLMLQPDVRQRLAAARR